MAKFKPYRVSQSQLTDLPIVEGQFIVTTDTQKIYFDKDNSNRIELGADSYTGINHIDIDENNLIGLDEETTEFFDGDSLNERNGNSLCLTDVYERTVNELKLSKLSTQETTTGKNTLVYPYYDTTKTDGTMTFTVHNDGSITINGTADGNKYFYFYKSNTTLNSNYILSSGTTNNNIILLARNTSSQFITGDTSITLPADTYSQIAIQIPNGTVLSNVKVYPMLRLASITDDTWEKYTNGPAPNPLYPQEVKTVKGYRNLFDKNSGTSVNGATKSINNEQIQITGINGYSSYFWTIDVSTLNSIIISGSIISGSYSKIYILKDNDFAMQVTTIGEFKNTINVSTNSTLTIYLYGNSGATLSESTTSVYENIMLSTIDVSYVPYGTNWIYTKVNGKNISPVNSKTITGITNASGQVGSINGTVIVKDIPITNNTTYYISGTFPLQLTNIPVVFLYNGTLSATTHNGTYTEIVSDGRGIQASENATEITNTGNYEYMAITTGTRATYSASTSVTMEISNLMVSIVPNETYEAYKEKIITIPLNDNEICGIGDYKDELIIDKNGHVKLNKKIGKITCDGSDDENWTSVNVTSSRSAWRINIDNIEQYTSQSAIPNLISNYFIKASQAATWQEGIISRIASTSENIVICLNSEINIASKLKTWLNTHNTDVYYVLETPQLIDLDYNVDLTLYEGANNITNSEDMNMSIKYYNKSINGLYNSLIDEIDGNITEVAINGTPVATQGVANITSIPTNILTPFATKTYTDIIGDSSDNAESKNGFLFGSVRPTSYTETWEIRYRVRVWVPNNTNYEAMSEGLVTGAQNVINSYAYYNHFLSTSYRPVYYHDVYRLTSSGYTAGYGHAIGISLADSNNRGDTSLKRSITVEILSQKNCTFTLNDTAVKWANWSGSGSDNYHSVSRYNFSSNGLVEVGDTDTVNQLRSNYARYLTSTNGLYGYNLCSIDVNNKLQGFQITDQTTATGKVKNSAVFKIGAPIYYYASSTNVGSGVYTSDNTLVLNTAILDLRYSTNCAQTLTANLPVYLVGTPSGSTYTLADTWWTQTLPSTDDGKIYILLGISIDGYRIGWEPIHPIYWYKNGALQLYIDTAAKAISDKNGNDITSSYVTIATNQTITGTKTFSQPINLTSAANIQYNSTDKCIEFNFN